MKKYLAALAVLTLGTALALPPIAHATEQKTKTASKATAKKTVHTKKAVKKTPPISKEDEDDPEPDVTGSVAVDYSCELGNKLTIHANLADQNHIALRWRNRLIRLDRVGTTTGANRFESSKRGLVWIGIPAKGILLDSRKGQQLANECKSAEQLAMKDAPAAGGVALIAAEVPGADKSAARTAASVAVKK